MFALFVRAEAAERAGGQVRGENRQLTPSCSAPFLAHVHMCDTQTHMHTQRHTCTNTRLRTYACTHTSTHVHTQAHTCTHKHTCAQAHTSINTSHGNTQTHTGTSTHMRTCTSWVGGLQLSSRSWLAGLLRPEVWAGPHMY